MRQIFVDHRLYDPAAEGPGENHRHFFECALLCENVKRTYGDALLGDPMEIALVHMARAAMRNAGEFLRLDEIPFDSNRKRLSTLHRTPDGIVLYTKGAPEVVLTLSREVEIDGLTQPLTPEIKQKFLSAHEAMAAKGPWICDRLVVVDYFGARAIACS